VGSTVQSLPQLAQLPRLFEHELLQAMHCVSEVLVLAVREARGFNRLRESGDCALQTLTSLPETLRDVLPVVSHRYSSPPAIVVSTPDSSTHCIVARSIWFRSQRALRHIRRRRDCSLPESVRTHSGHVTLFGSTALSRSRTPPSNCCSTSSSWKTIDSDE
jgi:hypothetical protein